MLMLGGCIGSFLNVVIYRWPRDLSIRKPARSFCPICSDSIAWYDNIPVVSFLLLRGRCRHCRAPISLQYPLVELATALLFLMTFDVLFVAHQRGGISGLSHDWPILLGHLLLWAGMIALAVMDLQAYVVDIRVTWILAAAGLAVHTIWTPARSLAQAGWGWIRPEVTQAGMVASAAVGMLIGVWLFLRGPYPEDSEDHPVDEPPADEQLTASDNAKFNWRWLLLIVPVALVAAYVVCLAPLPMPQRLTSAEIQAGVHPMSVGWLRIGGGLLILMLGLTLAAGRSEPEIDAEINEALDAEAPDARRNTLSELKFLSPAIVLAVVAVLVLRLDGVPGQAERILHWQPVGQWRPVLGLATGMSGWVIGGAIGWATRIVFTLIFGKEAFGLGDVHILAAIGAVAGWPVVLVGFFLAAPLTLIALLLIQLWPQQGRIPYAPWVMVVIFVISLLISHMLLILAVSLTLLIILFIHMRRQSRALPYGPWLALGCLIASIYQDQLINFLRTCGLFGYTGL